MFFFVFADDGLKTPEKVLSLSQGSGFGFSSSQGSSSSFLRLSPPATERDYLFNLTNAEGLADLFDVAASGYPGPS